MAFYICELIFYSDLFLDIIFVTYSHDHNLDTDTQNHCSVHNLIFKFPNC